MTGLIEAEILRFVSRRLFRLIGLIAVALILAFAVTTFVQSSNDPDAGLADARRDVAECEALRQEANARERGVIICPTAEELAPQYDKRFVYVEEMADATRGVAIASFILSFVIAASFVGADWGSGSIVTLLTWEPRRGRVLAAKVITASAMLALATALLLALVDFIYLPVAALRGSTEGLSGSEWWTLAGIWVRGAGLAAFAAAVSSGIATITRNTAGPIGVAFAYGIVLDSILGFIRGGRLRPWLLQDNIGRLLGLPTFADPAAPPSGDIRSLVPTTPGITRPIVLFTCYAAFVLALAYVAFRQRDIT